MRMQDIDFLVIGAAKSATTWLQRCLQRDPSILMPDPELHYFSRQFDRGHEWYLSQFARTDAHHTVGEKSNSYLDQPDAAQRIRNALPNARLIVQLRNPIERAYSDYCMLLRRGEVGRDIERYLDPRLAGGDRFLNGGRYYEQLKAYLDLFDRKQLLVLFYEDVQRTPQRQLDHVHGFLELGAAVELRPIDGKIKDKTVPILPLGLRRMVKPLKPMLSPFRQHAVFRALHATLAKEESYPSLSAELCLRIMDYYARDAEQLGSLVGQDLSGWLSDVRFFPKEVPQRPAALGGRALAAVGHRNGPGKNSP